MIRKTVMISPSENQFIPIVLETLNKYISRATDVPKITKAIYIYLSIQLFNLLLTVLVL